MGPAACLAVDRRFMGVSGDLNPGEHFVAVQAAAKYAAAKYVGRVCLSECRRLCLGHRSPRSAATVIPRALRGWALHFRLVVMVCAAVPCSRHGGHSGDALRAGRRRPPRVPDRRGRRPRSSLRAPLAVPDRPAVGRAHGGGPPAPAGLVQPPHLDRSPWQRKLRRGADPRPSGDADLDRRAGGGARRRREQVRVCLRLVGVGASCHAADREPSAPRALTRAL